MSALKIALPWANALCKFGSLPSQQPDVCADGLSLVLSGVSQLDADSRVATRALDDASWQHLFLRDRPSRRRAPKPPQPGLFGEAVLEKLSTFPVCTVSGEPGAGKSRDVPSSLLGTLMERQPHRQHGIAMIMELKEAQNALYDHNQCSISALHHACVLPCE